MLTTSHGAAGKHVEGGVLVDLPYVRDFEDGFH